MSRTARRILLAQAYVLHTHPFRDTSRILEVFTREQGRVSVFARGVRGPKARLASLLQPFQPLLISFTARGDAGQLISAESAPGPAHDHAGSLTGGLPPAALLSGFYLNELLLKLTTRHDPNADLFDGYRAALSALTAGGPPEPALRSFELRLLRELGYGLDLTHTVSGGVVTAQGYYHFRAADGLFATTAEHSGALQGSSLLQLSAGLLREGRELADARKVLSAALEHCLEGRPIATRAVARACVGTALVPRPAEVHK
ncbi:MAG TPA: DNA repair protein RecO [Steroidobacteraceae bacterium]|jgi:DNA repair protein RecO (recombination protein O)|nr:DNA repair protein RecO [Steroidobacteraceae bacterium]